MDIEQSMDEFKIMGERIYLRKVRKSDVNGPYHKWMNDPEVTQFLESRFSDTGKEGIAKFVEDAAKNKDILFLAIMLRDGNRHIGNIKLGPINKQHRTAEIGIMVGEKDCWGKGYGTEAIKLLSDYAFKKLGLHKLTAGCYANNLGSEKAFIKAGFEREGVRKSQCLCDGKYVDGLIFGFVNPYKEE